MNSIEEAVQLFDAGYVCSQAVFASFSEDLNLPKEQALKIGACFGSGMRRAEVCGACTGALMVLGLKYGQCQKEDIDSRMKANNVTDLFLDEFKDINGSYICNQLLNCDISTKDGVEAALEKKLFTEFCPKMVKSAVEIVERIMEE